MPSGRLRMSVFGLHLTDDDTDGSREGPGQQSDHHRAAQAADLEALIDEVGRRTAGSTLAIYGAKDVRDTDGREPTGRNLHARARRGVGEHAMTILDHEQGSRAWVEARLGIPTASAVRAHPDAEDGCRSRHRPAPLQAPSCSPNGFTGEPVEEFDTEWTERGRALEPMARSYYAIQRDVDVRAVGLCLRPVPCAPHLSVGAVAVGASPDGTRG